MIEIEDGMKVDIGYLFEVGASLIGGVLLFWKEGRASEEWMGGAADGVAMILSTAYGKAIGIDMGDIVDKEEQAESLFEDVRAHLVEIIEFRALENR